MHENMIVNMLLTYSKEDEKYYKRCTNLRCFLRTDTRQNAFHIACNSLQYITRLLKHTNARTKTRSASNNVKA